MSDSGKQTPGATGLSWQNPTVRALFYQAVVVGAVGMLVWYLVSNTLHNLAARNIATGFSFLDREAGFAIGESLIDYGPSDTYRRAIVVGLVNTLRVSFIALVLATLVGVVIGIARLSKNWLVAKCAAAYVEAIRNVPLLLQLLIWYAFISEILPGPKDALHPLPGTYLSNRGLMVPALEGGSLGAVLAGIAIAALIVCAEAARRRKVRQRTGDASPMALFSVGVLVALPVIAWFASGRQLNLAVPIITGFGFSGGWTFSPELFALLAGLITYTAGFIAEIVRSGIQAVNRGQWEAANSLGLRASLVLRLVVLPQALRVIVPPLTSQYLNVVKNSSLAVAIGYPDLVAVVNTTLNQTGQAIEGFLIIMAAYLTVSLLISLFMNWYNARIMLVER